MNWKDDQIEKLILFYSHNNLFLEIWYQKSCNCYQKLVPDSGQYVMGIRNAHRNVTVFSIHGSPSATSAETWVHA